MMTPKERLLAAINGREVDRLPWSPFLAYFWDFQTQELKDRGALSFLEEIGADPLFRGSHGLCNIAHKRCEIRDSVAGKERVTTYETPVGTLHAKQVYVEQGDTWFLVEHPVKTKEDFKVLTFLNEDAEVIPNIKGFSDDYMLLGNKGLYVPLIGSEGKTSFQSLVEYWVGTEELVYALADYPEAVEECIAAMGVNSIKTAYIDVTTPAESFIFWEDSSTTNISPSMFDKYTAPEISEWARILHANDKKLIHHACGHIRALVPLMKKTGIDIIESISPPPTGNIELWEAKEMLNGEVGLIGGIEPTVFLNSTLEQLEGYVQKLIDKMGKKSFILANSDSCPPGVSIEKFKLITDIVSRM